MEETRHESWLEISEFPDYAVSTLGRIMNGITELIKVPTANQQGIPSVILTKEKQHYRRGVALLVSQHFLEKPRHFSFDTPINLDGDRFNNEVSNLAWRPRWFALKYHRQFTQPRPYKFDGQIEVLQTSEIFDDVREYAMAYGLLETDVLQCASNKIPVFPTWHDVQIVSN